jgi:hypothetical protein
MAVCENIYVKDAVPFGCGQCLPCRVKKRREWTNRIMLESMCYETNAFLTLTYSPENLPKDGTLNYDHLKQFRDNIKYHAGQHHRYYQVGEYGDLTKRPHYHAALFGFPGCASADPKCPCHACETIRRAWPYGHILNGTLTKDSASYISGYVTKKLTDKKPYEKYAKLLQKGKNNEKAKKAAEKYKELVIDELNGRDPETARMSLKPGIGAGPDNKMIKTLQKMLWTDHGNQLMYELGDVPDIIKINGKEILLGRYLKNKLREEFNVSEKDKEKKMSQLREEKIKEYLTYRQETMETTKALGQKEFLKQKHIQKIRNIHKRYQINGKKGEL